MGKRVVITGLGTLSPIGNNTQNFWNHAKEGRCGIDFLDPFSYEPIKASVCASVKNFDPKNHMSLKESKRLDRFSQLALVAAKEAFKDAHLHKTKISPYRLGVILGTGVGGMNTLLHETQHLMEQGMNFVSPLFIPKSLPNMASANIALHLGAKGMCHCITTACAASTDAIGQAFLAIQSNQADIIISGGSESCINPMMLAGFTNLGALSLSKDPTKASIPFDEKRDGFVMGEGAGILILEDLDHALKRDAPIYAEIVGYGSTNDAYHLTRPPLTADGAKYAMSLAIKHAGIDPSQISYINAHGTSTPANDKIETLAIKEIFKESAYDLPISSTKSMIGHLLGAAGAIEGIACVKSLEENFIHPTIGLEKEDLVCDLDYVKGKGRIHSLEYVLSNSFGFGGHNSCVIFKNWS